MHLALALLLTAAAHAQPPPKLPLSPCRLKGLAAQTLCGTLEVPEDRAHPQTRTLKLKVAVVPALARSAAPDPLFLLAGGPGQAITEVAGPLATALEKVRRTRDLVLVDQRGTGSSNGLDCELLPEDAPLQQRLRADLLTPERLRECQKKWSADLRFYGTSIAMQDLDDVRAALGYDQIDVWGGSYGTRAALVYLREHGEHVRSVVLDGVAPLSMYLPLTMAQKSQRALDLLFEHCGKDPACSQAFPDLPARFQALLQKFPVHTTVAHPLTGEPVEVTLTRELFVQALRGQLYLPDLSVLMPLTIDHAARGDWAPFVAQNAGLEQGVERTLYLGLLFAVACTEDLPFLTDAQLDEAARGTFLGAGLAHTFANVCKAFPRGEVKPGFRDPVRSDKPVLLLSGELDPVTPPSEAADAARTLPNSLQITVPGVGHGVTHRGCVPGLVARFVADGSAKNLDTSCVNKSARPPFFTSFAGPTP